MRRTLAEWLELQQSVHARGIDLGLVARRAGGARARRRPPALPGHHRRRHQRQGLGRRAFSRRCCAQPGCRTGVFTSPHLVRYNERIRVDGAEAATTSSIDAFERIEAARGETTLTYFEYNTLAALLVFASAQGRRRGARSRARRAARCGEHRRRRCRGGVLHRLRSSRLAGRHARGDRAREGRHLPRRAVRRCSARRDMPASVFEAIRARRRAARDRRARFRLDGRSEASAGTIAARRRRCSRTCRRRRSPAPIQYRNAATALAAVEALALQAARHAPQRRARRLRGVQLAGPLPDRAGTGRVDSRRRAQRARRARARRASGRAALRGPHDRGREHPRRQGRRRDRQRRCDPVVDHWILCTLHEPRGLPRSELAGRLALAGERRHAGRLGRRRAASRRRALAKPGDRVVVCGSFLVVGAALQWLRLY